MPDRPPRPDSLDLKPDRLPETLRERDQWVCWQYQWMRDRGEWSKIPVDPNTGRNASSTDSDTWSSVADALGHHAKNDTDGVGFVVSEEQDMIVGLDLDDCRDPETGAVDEWTEEIVDEVPTYWEVSPSGTGLRAFALGVMPDGRTRADVGDSGGHMEMYETGRYLTMTGHRLDESTDDVEQVRVEIEAVHSEYLAEDAEQPGEQTGLEDTTPARTSSETELEDAELIEKAKNAENGDKFERLWRGDTLAYPSHSEARMALANLLAFWTGGDEQRMLDLFKQSSLIRDEDDVRTWTEYEAPKAVRNVTEVYDPQKATDGGEVSPPAVPEVPEQTETTETATNSGASISLSPDRVVATAGLGEGEDVDDLKDRQKAAAVWELMWRSDDYHVRVRRDTGGLWAYDGGVWTREGERKLRHAGREALGPMNYSANVLSELKAQARADPRAEIEEDQMGVPAGMVAVENGLLDLKKAASGNNDALQDLEPEDYAITQLPVKYDPDAEADRWAELVEEWAEDGRAEMLQEYVGYCLHVGNLPIHRALLLVGSGANGKGTFLSVVRALLGDENTRSTELQTLANERDAVADLYGHIANIDDDLSARSLGKGLGMFKKLVAGDRVRGRHLYEEGFEFHATAKHLYAANEVPDVSVPEDDEAFWRRWILVEFPNHYPKRQRDPDLRDRLTTDETLSGVLNWAVEGWNRLMNQGHFTNEHDYAQQKRDRWQSWGDDLDKFVEECVDRDEEAPRISTSDAYDRFCAWCAASGKDAVGQQQFTNRLKKENVGYKQRVRIDGTPTRGYVALGFSEDVPKPRDGEDRDTDQQSLT